MRCGWARPNQPVRSPTATTRATATAAAIPAMTRLRPVLRPRAAAAGLAKAGAPGAGAWVAAWDAVVPAPLLDRSVPQVLQNLLPSGFLAPQLGQNMGVFRRRARAPPVPPAWLIVLRFYTPVAYNGQVPHPPRTSDGIYGALRR